MRYWRDRYGARIASMTDDVVEFTVDAPPSTQQQAYALAWEQYAYCADIVDQGTQTLSNLAAGLIDADAWFFWWD